MNIQALAPWLLQNGYSVMFLLMLIEGPVVTAAGAFAAALGYFHLWIVFLLSIIGNLIPDIVYYALGYWGRETFIEKYGRYMGLTPKKIKQVEQIAEKHPGKWLIVVKLVSFLATPGLIVAGVTRMDIKKYIYWSLAVTLPSSLFYLILGYYFGAAYDRVTHYLNIGGYIILAAIIVIILLGYFQRKFSDRLLDKMGK